MIARGDRETGPGDNSKITKSIIIWHGTGQPYGNIPWERLIAVRKKTLKLQPFSAAATAAGGGGGGGGEKERESMQMRPFQ